MARAAVVAVALILSLGTSLLGAQPGTREDAARALKKAATFYRTKVASHGGYLYYYSPDLKDRWGEGKFTADTIFVQPPGTPTIGMAYLRAHAATGDAFYLDAAKEAAEALVAGQLQSGGWRLSRCTIQARWSPTFKWPAALRAAAVEAVCVAPFGDALVATVESLGRNRSHSPGDLPLACAADGMLRADDGDGVLEAFGRLRKRLLAGRSRGGPARA